MLHKLQKRTCTDIFAELWIALTWVIVNFGQIKLCAETVMRYCFPIVSKLTLAVERLGIRTICFSRKPKVFFTHWSRRVRSVSAPLPDLLASLVTLPNCVRMLLIHILSWSSGKYPNICTNNCILLHFSFILIIFTSWHKPLSNPQGIKGVIGNFLTSIIQNVPIALLGDNASLYGNHLFMC